MSQKGHPYDIILHKVSWTSSASSYWCNRQAVGALTADAMSAPSTQLPTSEAKALDWERKLLEYSQLNPRVTVVDTPQACKVVRGCHVATRRWRFSVRISRSILFPIYTRRWPLSAQC